MNIPEWLDKNSDLYSVFTKKPDVVRKLEILYENKANREEIITHAVNIWTTISPDLEQIDVSEKMVRDIYKILNVKYTNRDRFHYFLFHRNCLIWVRPQNTDEITEFTNKNLYTLEITAHVDDPKEDRIKFYEREKKKFESLKRIGFDYPGITRFIAEIISELR